MLFRSGEELTRAVATQATLVNLARIASPAVADVLISVVSAEVAVLVDAATFLLSAALLQAVGKGASRYALLAQAVVTRPLFPVRRSRSSG